MTTDPIADLLTRIRNSIMAGHEKLDMPSSKMKIRIAEILQDEGYINGFKLIKNHKQGILRIYIKWVEPKKSAITGLKRVSKPGRRVYSSFSDIPRVLRGMGIAIVSTSKGIVTDSVARREKRGGEVVCYIW